jgi:hypothetical protein
LRHDLARTAPPGAVFVCTGPYHPEAMDADLEAAWDAVWDGATRTLDGRPAVIRPRRPPTDGYRGAWSVTARGPHPGRGKAPQTVTGAGENEAAALRDLDATLRGAKPADGSYLEQLRERLRLAYVDGAEEWTRENVGRGLTSDELGRVIGRYVGRP